MPVHAGSMTEQRRAFPDGPSAADAIGGLLLGQAGVISRAQAHACGEAVWDVRRRLRRREWVRLLDGIYLDHTGEPTWLQRSWAGVLYLWPAALAADAAVRAVLGPGWRRHDDREPIEIAVDRDRHVRAPVGYRVRRTTSFDERVLWNARPPRIRLEDAAVDLAARQPGEFEAIAVLAEICHSRRTTAARVRDAWAARTRLRRRIWLGQVLDDIAEGTCSVLEHGYLTRVERAHGLPSGTRQTPQDVGRGPEFYDVTYARQHLIVELDGRLFHDSARARDVDLDRDLDAASLAGGLTVRLGWGQVFDRPCRTTQRLVVLLRNRGWRGTPVHCGPTCPVRP
jgi:very-short-patch-repair endonuclease